MADFLDAKVKEIEERLRELRPLVAEYERLEAVAAVLGEDTGVGSRRGGGQAVAPRRAARQPAAKRGRGGRPPVARSGKTRATQTVELVRRQPGITIPNLAEHLGIKPNYLYRVLPQLEEEGKVRREGRGWHPG